MREPPNAGCIACGAVLGNGTLGWRSFLHVQPRGVRQKHTLYYAVKMTGSERPTLERLQEYFGVGAIYDVAARPPTKPNAPASKTAVMYRVQRDEELAVIVDHFDHYPLQSQKREVYEIWRLMALLKLKSGNNEIGCLSELAEEITRRCIAKQPWR